MALARRSGRRFEANIWPGFVDAMTALLLVLVFVLSIFMIVQFMLRETITTQDSELDVLSEQVRSLAEALGLEQRRGFTLEQEVGRLDGALQEQLAQAEAQAALIASLNTQSQAQAGRIASFEEQVAGLLAQRTDLRTRIAGLSADLEETGAARDEASAQVVALSARIEDIEAGLAREITEKEAAQLALAQARDEIDESTEAARLAAARREALQALIADLRARNATQAGELGVAMQQLTKTSEKLSAAEAVQLADAAAAAALRERLENADAELTAMSLRLEDERAKAEETLTLLAAANSATKDLDTKLLAALEAERSANASALETESALQSRVAELLKLADENSSTSAALERDLRQEIAAALAAERAAREEAGTALSEAEARAVLLATANNALSQEQAANLESQRQVEALNQQVATLRKQIGGLQEILDEAEARDAEADVQISALGSQLNTALARVAAEEKRRAALEEAERKRLEEEAKELKNYRSEFFGQIRALLGDQEGIRIVGDRFVFSSEVLFEPGKATLSDAGQGEIAKISDILRSISRDIPAGLDWVIRVDGHTDNVPLLGTGEFADNWELSQARALSVVRYMVDFQGISPKRLAANGFGEFQPIALGDDDEARAQNRRIELKLTER